MHSVVCCGHSPNSQITHMAFHPTGSFLVSQSQCAMPWCSLQLWWFSGTGATVFLLSVLASQGKTQDYQVRKSVVIGIVDHMLM